MCEFPGEKAQLATHHVPSHGKATSGLQSRSGPGSLAASLRTTINENILSSARPCAALRCAALCGAVRYEYFGIIPLPCGRYRCSEEATSLFRIPKTAVRERRLKINKNHMGDQYDHNTTTQH
ncbi:hypothetical protein RR46_04309 [Papilio xuthus]|uniref:Uncharacterized protein n=1 Tax=Papilio xuthus TaxID=66420 RepID=A0A194QDZ5_PAPXU|nr:hypothetical protein RR46_04309 [Papilio xuthus]